MDFLADALPALNGALDLVARPAVLGYLLLGVVLGLCIGVFPGLGGIAGLSLLLPFMFGMDPILGLALMIGLVAVVPTSDTFASVLMGIPGSSASQATVLDGFPLAKKGEAARALSAAFSASLFGGLIGALFLTLFILAARPVVLAFGLPEMLMVTILGLSMVAILAGRVALKGLAAAGLGLMVGTIGVGDANGELRMATYDMPYLLDGLKLVIVGLGVFAIPEIISLLRQDRAIAKDARLGAGWLDGVRDWARNIWLSVRCSLIGVTVGVIPGLGGSVVDWIAYGHTVQTTKDKSKFGQGEIRGVIGPESSNNAKEGGGLVPTLLFGIPGSGSMAIFIGAIALLGSGSIEVGPSMLKDNLDYTYAIVWLLALANVFGTLLCIAVSPGVARLTTIRFTLVAPFLFILISFAAFQSGQVLADLAALFAFGLLGIFLRRFDWSRPAFLIGFVLSDPTERFINQAYQIAASRFRRGFEDGLEYVFSPIVIVLLIITLVSIFFGVRQAKALHGEGQGVQSGSKRAPLIFLLCVIAYLSVAFIDAWTIPDYAMTDKIIPVVIGGVSILCCLLLLGRMILAPETDVVFADREAAGDDANAPHGLWSTLAWFAGLLIVSSLLGFILALGLFLLAFFRLRARVSWGFAALLTASGVGFMTLLAWLLNRDFPPGLLQSYVSLPWPLGGCDVTTLLTLPGDGVGPEITQATQTVLEAAAARFGVRLDLRRMEIGFAALERFGDAIPDSVIEAAKAADGVILGPVSHNAYPPASEGGRNPSGVLRKALELRANIRPARSRTFVPQPIAAPVDLIVVRENLEGFYADRNMHQGVGEFAPEPGVALAMRKITSAGSRKIAETGFALAAARPARKVAVAHKANVMRLTDGVFLQETRAVAQKYPHIAYEEVLIDAAAALIVRDPSRFDVIVTTNMFGDILSDLASECAGGLGLAASLNVGDRWALAQAQHGSAPDIAGQGRANPASLILSAAMLLRHLSADAPSLAPLATAIESAVETALASPETRTRDLGGRADTAAFADAVSRAVQEA